MKRTFLVRYMVLPLCLSALLFGGCGNVEDGKKDDTAVVAENTDKTTDGGKDDTKDDSTSNSETKAEEKKDVPSNSDLNLEETNPDVLTMGEGSNITEVGEKIDGSTASVHKVGDVISFEKDGVVQYTLTINSIAVTDRRNDYADTNPEKVVLIDYTYKNVAYESEVFLDNMSFKLADTAGGACLYYAIGSDKQALPVAVGADCNMEIAYGVSASDTKVTLYYTDLFCGSNEMVAVEADLK